ncbi:MAG: hypothetical protein L0K82_03690, partial [Pisciglobus halotolerans]|nr:hypothetical protein [Pisciglobus halotolerans]
RTSKKEIVFVLSASAVLISNYSPIIIQRRGFNFFTLKRSFFKKIDKSSEKENKASPIHDTPGML